MNTLLLDGIKEAVLGGDNLGSMSSRHNAQQEALNAALGSGRTSATTTSTPTPLVRTTRAGLLTRIKDFHQRVTRES